MGGGSGGVAISWAIATAIDSVAEPCVATSAPGLAAAPSLASA